MKKSEKHGKVKDALLPQRNPLIGKEVICMYDNNGYQNPYNFSTAPDQQQYPDQPYQNYQGQPQPPKKKKTSTGLVVGVIIAAIVFGSASGFGGSYLASRMEDGGNTAVTTPSDSNNPPESIEPQQTEPPEESMTTTEEYVRPETAVDESLSSLENMTAINTSRSYSYSELYKKVNESIVVINNYVSGSSYGESSEYVLYGTGSGVIFTSDGYIITNYHVINGFNKLSVVVSDSYSDGAEMEAVLVGSDSATDLAVLKVSRDEPFTAAALGDSDSLEIGQDVAAIGNPASLDKSLTRGIISGLNRYSSDQGYVLSSIQTDAAINPGNSGGGLFDMYGNVIGIVNSKLVASDSSIENLGFAITINEAKPVISDLINFGYVKGRPALGITTFEVKNQYTAQLYGAGGLGLLVTAINQDAPVAQSDLQVGDLITAVNGKEVTTVLDVQDIIKGMSAGDKVTVTVTRTTTVSNGYFGNSYHTSTAEVEIILTESK